MAVRLYPDVVVARQSFVDVKRCVVPKQSMSLREIVKRFVRREPLPYAHEGVYEERFGDLEKLAKADIVIQMEEVERLKQQIANFEKKYQEQQEKLRKEKEAKIVEPVPKPVGGTPDPAPPPKGA